MTKFEVLLFRIHKATINRIYNIWKHKANYQNMSKRHSLVSCILRHSLLKMMVIFLILTGQKRGKHKHIFINNPANNLVNDLTIKLCYMYKICYHKLLSSEWILTSGKSMKWVRKNKITIKPWKIPPKNLFMKIKLPTFSIL